MSGGGRAAIFALGVASFFLSYEIVSGDGTASFGYTGNATAKWGNLSPAYKTCSTGTQQSPININRHNTSINTKLHGLDRLYKDANATLINNGFNVMLWFDQGAGYFSQDGKNYTLKQLHWHTPSEHTFDNQKFPLELHLVHQSEDGSVSVIGVLHEFGNPNPFIDQLKEVVAELAKDHFPGNEKPHLSVGLVRTKALRRHARRFIKYSGSFTTPPCTENVSWYILGKVRKVSREQVALLRSPLAREFQHNARPTQPLNGRAVELYDESKFDHHSH